MGATSRSSEESIDYVTAKDQAVDMAGVIDVEEVLRQILQTRRETVTNKGDKTMTIAIPVEEKSPEVGVCPSFGRAPWFFLYNNVTKEHTYLDNPAASAQGGAGILAAQFVADNGVKALLTPRCGANAEEVLRKAEVLIYQSIPGTVKENIEAFLADQLVLLAEFHEGFHGHNK